MSLKVVKGKPATAGLLARDLKTLTVFFEIYCLAHHAGGGVVVALKGFYVKKLAGHELRLCGECTKLLTHALVKRSVCPMDPKPMCKHCPSHCYAAGYREKIREVMKFSGKRLVM